MFQLYKCQNNPQQFVLECFKRGIPFFWDKMLPPSVIRSQHFEAKYCSELEGSKCRRRAILMLEDENTTLL